MILGGLLNYYYHKASGCQDDLFRAFGYYGQKRASESSLEAKHTQVECLILTHNLLLFYKQCLAVGTGWKTTPKTGGAINSQLTEAAVVLKLKLLYAKL